MKLHNTLTRQTEEFKPLGKVVQLYSCGPTVYDYAHLGNLRAYVFTDTLRRALEASDFEVKQVMNITDVGHLVSDEDEGEDKLEKGAEREGKTVWEVSEFYIDTFKRDVERLNILPPNGYRDEKRGDCYARATDFISQQIEMIKILLDKGFAYLSPEAVYFDVSRLSSYGELTGQKLEDKETAVRPEVVTDRNKRNPQDFALWFFTVGRFAKHSMHWPSPWGEGFPGWHLECSAIIHDTLGETIDIHTGGVDHIGTHHTNEMAQTEAAFDKKLAGVWLHNEHILVDGKKMSKSSGNFYTLEDIIKKGYDPLALRLLYLQSHYRSQTNFKWEALDAAQNRLKAFKAMADLRWQATISSPEFDFKRPIMRIKKQLKEDLDTLSVIAFLSALEKNLSERLINQGDLDQFVEMLEFIDKTLGLKLSQLKDIDNQTKALISQREVARTNHDWVKADELRAKLSELNIEIHDTPHGPIWSRG